MSDVFYYTGECNSSEANLLEIQNNFIAALTSSKFNASCINEPFCRAEFVNVTCGPIQSRRRRDIHQHYLLKRSVYPLAYAVEFELLVPLNGNDTHSNFQIKAALLQDMVTEIQNEMDTGHFDIQPSNMHIEHDSFSPGIPEYKCPKGTKPRRSTESCGKHTLLFLRFAEIHLIIYVLHLQIQKDPGQSFDNVLFSSSKILAQVGGFGAQSSSVINRACV